MEPSPDQSNKEAKAYDKILKENFRSILLPIIAKRENIEIVEYRPLPEEINTTINRNVDFLMEVFDAKGDHFILHIEFQTEAEADMVFRVGEYHGFLQRQYKLEIRHFVVYLAKGKTKMATNLPENLQYSGYKLIQLSQIPIDQFIESDLPEEIVLAILSKFPKTKLDGIIRLILQRLQKVCQNQAELEKFIYQLTILSQIRKFDLQTQKIVKAMPITLDITQNAFYKDALKKGWQEGHEQGIEQGIEQGVEREKRDFTQKLWILQEFSIEKIALLVDLSLEEVTTIIVDHLKAEGISEADAVHTIEIYLAKFEAIQK